MDWADEKAIELGRNIYKVITLSRRNDAYDAYHEAKFVGDIAPTLAAALRQERDEGRAEGRQHENEKCQELIGARVGATQ